MPTAIASVTVAVESGDKILPPDGVVIKSSRMSAEVGRGEGLFMCRWDGAGDRVWVCDELLWCYVLLRSLVVCVICMAREKHC